METILTPQNFEAEVLASELPVLVDFFAPWCAPCRMLAPIIEEIAQEYEGKVKVAKANVDEAGELAARFGIVSIPTLVLVKDGSVVKTSVGYLPKEEVQSMLEGI
jgi:thioredoxin 1